MYVYYNRGTKRFGINCNRRFSSNNEETFKEFYAKDYVKGLDGPWSSPKWLEIPAIFLMNEETVGRLTK